MTDGPVVDGALPERIDIDDLGIGVHDDPGQDIHAVHSMTLELDRDILHSVSDLQAQRNPRAGPVVVADAAPRAGDLVVVEGLAQAGGLVDANRSRLEVDHGMRPVLVDELGA